MPLFSTKRKKEDHRHSNGNGIGAVADPPSPAVADRTEIPDHSQQNGQPSPATGEQIRELPVHKPKLVFHCQQAQGSPTGIISGFTNIKELYQKISECYDFPVADILFCTLNTHKADMSKLLGGQIGLDDFIFVHRKGQAKEVEITKSEDALGLTITDNGAGYSFIKRIKEGSLIDRIGFIQVGDHIEKINDVSMIGCRHFEVAKQLKDIAKGATFTLRLIEPLRAGFSHIGPRSGGGTAGSTRKGNFGSGKETLRLRAKGPATIEEAPNDVVQAALDKINNLLESYMGINDSELATQIWDLGKDKTNPHDFVTAIDSSDLEAFGFTDDFIFDLWGAISDAKTGRLVPEGHRTAM